MAGTSGSQIASASSVVYSAPNKNNVVTHPKFNIDNTNLVGKVLSIGPSNLFLGVISNRTNNQDNAQDYARLSKTDKGISNLLARVQNVAPVNSSYSIPPAQPKQADANLVTRTNSLTNTPNTTIIAPKKPYMLPLPSDTNLATKVTTNAPVARTTPTNAVVAFDLYNKKPSKLDLNDNSSSSSLPDMTSGNSPNASGLRAGFGVDAAGNPM